MTNNLAQPQSYWEKLAMKITYMVALASFRLTANQAIIEHYRMAAEYPIEYNQSETEAIEA